MMMMMMCISSSGNDTVALDMPHRADNWFTGHQHVKRIRFFYEFLE